MLTLTIQNFDSDFEDNSKQSSLETSKGFNSKTRINFRPFSCKRGFFKGALLLENDFEYLFKDNLIFSSNLKYSIWDNFEDLTIPPRDTYPAQVRSDIKII